MNENTANPVASIFAGQETGRDVSFHHRNRNLSLNSVSITCFTAKRQRLQDDSSNLIQLWPRFIKRYSFNDVARKYETNPKYVPLHKTYPEDTGVASPMRNRNSDDHHGF
jgi:hypothetical protein